MTDAQAKRFYRANDKRGRMLAARRKLWKLRDTAKAANEPVMLAKIDDWLARWRKQWDRMTAAIEAYIARCAREHEAKRNAA